MVSPGQMDRKPLLAIGLCAAASFWFWDTWALYPLKLLVVHFHESGHALATYLAGGRVESITVNHLQGGLTISRVPAGLLPQLLVASGGYVGSTLFGALILGAAIRRGSGQRVLAFLAAFLFVAMVLWIRDPFTFFFTCFMALALLAAARWLPPRWSRLTAIFLGVFSGLYALWDIRDDLLLPRGGGVSDADQLAKATGLPALAFAIVWLLVSLWVLWRVIHAAARAR